MSVHARPGEQGDPSSIDEQRLAHLWQEFKQRGSDAARERLILEYAPLVKYVAGRLAIALPAHIDFEDLVSYGLFGLVDAIERFDAGRGVKFETYAIARIRGSILDGLRSVDWVPRSVRQKARELDQVVARLESSLGRAATDAEIAGALGITREEYQRLLTEVAGTSLLSLDEVWSTDPEEEGKLRMLEMVEDTSAALPESAVEYQETRRLLAEAIDKLPERERLVVALYYFEGLTLKEIGQVLEVSESRVCQLHTKAIARLRGRMAMAG